MKRIISLILLTAAMWLPMNADTYRETLEQYLSTGAPSENVALLEQVLQSAVSSFDSAHAEQAAQVLTEYMTTQMMTDLADIYEPAFRQHVSEADLQELIRLYSNPQYQAIRQRSAAMFADMSQAQEYLTFVRQFQLAAMAITTGQPMPADMPAASDIPAEYQEVFMQYYQAAGVDEMLTGTFRSVGNMLTDALRKNGTPNAEAKVNELMQYVSRNMPTVIMSLAVKTMSIDDLQMMISVVNTDAYRHEMQAVSEVIGNPIEMASAMMGKLAEWMKTHYPQYLEPLQKRINDMQQVLQTLQ